jgi:hypothetical protein
MCKKPVIRKFEMCFSALIVGILVFMMATCSIKEEQSGKKPEATLVNWGDLVELCAVLNNNTYQQDEAITVTATVSVHTDVHLLSSLWCDTLSNWEIKLVNEQNQPVPPTRTGGGGTGCRLPLDITYDQPFEETFQLDTYFELSAPGTYTLTMAKYASTWESEAIKVTSKPVSFTRLP